jgi:hypothetical protein
LKLKTTAWLYLFLLLSFSSAIAQQQASPMVDHTRPHPRIVQTEATGKRVDLATLKGARLFTTASLNPEKPVPLVVHFHGAPWLVEVHTAQHLRRAALITIQLGSGPSVYRKPFEDVKLFGMLLDEARQLLGLKQGWSSITLMGFSAGYGGIRQVLRTPEYFSKVNNILLVDAMHASYSPEGKLLAEGGVVNAADIDIYVEFAKQAVLGKKNFVFTHSEIFPGTYASTTECADYLLEKLGLKRNPSLKEGPVGMQQLSAIDVKGFHLRGYAGNTAQDHVDHFQGMWSWFELLKIR